MSPDPRYRRIISGSAGTWPLAPETGPCWGARSCSALYRVWKKHCGGRGSAHLLPCEVCSVEVRESSSPVLAVQDRGSRYTCSAKLCCSHGSWLSWFKARDFSTASFGLMFSLCLLLFAKKASAWFCMWFCCTVFGTLWISNTGQIYFSSLENVKLVLPQ